MAVPVEQEPENDPNPDRPFKWLGLSEHACFMPESKVTVLLGWAYVSARRR